jgi:hypothetical protein
MYLLNDNFIFHQFRFTEEIQKYFQTKKKKMSKLKNWQLISASPRGMPDCKKYSIKYIVIIHKYIHHTNKKKVYKNGRETYT